MTDFDGVDYFTDSSLIPDPHPYYDHVRSKDPVCCPISNGVLAVTGWQAANTVYKDSEHYSSCVAVMGPFTPLPFLPRVTTSARRSSSTAPRSRCSSTWSRWIRRSTPTRDRSCLAC